MMQLNVWYDLASEKDYVASLPHYSGPEHMQPMLPGTEGPHIDTTLRPRLEEQLPAVVGHISTALQTLFGPDVPSQVIVRITSYGFGGSYHLQGDWSRPGCGVTVRKDRLFDANVSLKTDVLVHELIHVCIEPQLRQKGWPTKYDPRREWLVDEIMRSKECHALCPGHQHQSKNEAPKAGLGELNFTKRPTY
jgi:hypothetical protein